MVKEFSWPTLARQVLGSSFIRNGLCASLCMTAFVLSAAAAKDLDMPSDAKHLKPGLWETTMTSETVEAPVVMGEAQLSGLDPAARARVEAVLKKQAAERAARGGAPSVKTRTAQECVTQAVLDKRLMSFDEDRRDGNHEKDCKTVVKSRTSSKADVTSVCASEDFTLNVEMIYEVKSPELALTQMVRTGSVRGQPTSSKVVASSRWLGADCGNAKMAH